jgi:GTP-binding protein HflX
LEVDRREITRRISHLKSELNKVREHRSRHRQQRRRSRVPVVALVGYTNAGKSTLLRALSNADVLVADRLFSTLDPTTRRISPSGGHPFLLTDTVGFIQKLPATVIAAFRATLEEISEADLLLHVIDCAHPNASAQAQVVLDTLAKIGVGDGSVITALNKSDQLSGNNLPEALVAAFPEAVVVSGLARSGLERLHVAIQGVLKKHLVEITVDLPYTDGDMISLFHRHALVSAIEHNETGVRLCGELPKRIAARFKRHRRS